MTVTREASAKFLAIILEEGSPRLSLHFKEGGHMIVSIDENMVDLLASEIMKARKELKKSAEIPAL